jgi:hypothetical protein
MVVSPAACLITDEIKSAPPLPPVGPTVHPQQGQRQPAPKKNSIFLEMVAEWDQMRKRNVQGSAPGQASVEREIDAILRAMWERVNAGVPETDLLLLIDKDLLNAITSELFLNPRFVSAAELKFADVELRIENVKGWRLVLRSKEHGSSRLGIKSTKQSAGDLNSASLHHHFPHAGRRNP